MKVPNTNVKEYCYKCRTQTNQEVVLHTTSTHSEHKVGGNPEVWISTHTLYKVYRCIGCEHVTLTRWRYDSDLDRELDTLDAEHFPPRTFRDKPSWYTDLDPKYRSIMEEIYTSLANRTNRLSLMGCRTVIDLYLNDEVGDIGGFARKLEKLYEGNGISEVSKNILNSAIEAGNAASHRAFSPDEDVLLSVVDIIENLLQQVVLRKKSKEIIQATPRRNES